MVASAAFRLGGLFLIGAVVWAVQSALGAPPGWALVLAGLFLIDFAGRVGTVLVGGRREAPPS
jgi:hypothetical protein